MKMTMMMMMMMMMNVLPVDSSTLQDFQNEIDSNSGAMSTLRQHILTGAGKHEMFRNLSEFCDRFGPRMTGSRALEDSIDFLANKMRQNGFIINLQNVTMPKWTRGQDSATVQYSAGQTRSLELLSAGLTVGTSGTLRARALVVKSFDQLREKGSEVRGKIVVFNQPWTNYSVSGSYRKSGATEAARLGAVAVLIRSVTSLSVYSPHTGMLTYNSSVTRIPGACIAVEDAEWLQRLQDRGESFNITLTINSRLEGNTVSRNLIIDMLGSTQPDQYVIVGGHIDSWDVGTGALDDGAGVYLALQVITTLKALNLRTKKTIRVIMWTGEYFKCIHTQNYQVTRKRMTQEQGLFGGLEYYNKSSGIQQNVSLIMESDRGVFKPRGLRFTGSNLSRDILQHVMHKYLSDLKIIETSHDGASSDTRKWVESGVPGAELFSYNENYYVYHHSKGDTVSALNPDYLDLASLLWTSVVYNVANLDALLPRQDPVAPTMASKSVSVTSSCLTSCMTGTLALLTAGVVKLF